MIFLVWHLVIEQKYYNRLVREPGWFPHKSNIGGFNEYQFHTHYFLFVS
jgi:hypothetical protein